MSTKGQRFCVTGKGLTWELLNSLWMLWTVTFLLSCISFFWIGARTRNRKWVLSGLPYLVINFALLFSTSWFEGLSPLLYGIVTIVFYASFLIAIVQAVMMRKGYLLKREALDRTW